MKENTKEFRMIFEFDNADGAVVLLKYGLRKAKCMNLECNRMTYLSAKLNLNERILEDDKDNYYPICPLCFYRSIKLISKHCDYF